MRVVEVLEEAADDIEDAIIFYNQQSLGVGEYFFWLLSDLHSKNILRLQNGTLTIIDALTGRLSEYYRRLHPKLANAAGRANALVVGEEVPPDDPFANVSDDDL